MTDRYVNNTKLKVKMMLEENDVPHNNECIDYIAMKWIKDHEEQIDQIDSENGEVDVYEDDSCFEIDLDDVLLYHISFQKVVFGGLRVKDVVAHFDSEVKYEVWVGNCFLRKQYNQSIRC